MSFSIILLIIASVLLVVAFVLTIKPMWVAAVPAWAAMMLLYWGEYILPVTLPTWKIAMWTQHRQPLHRVGISGGCAFRHSHGRKLCVALHHSGCRCGLDGIQPHASWKMD